MASGIHGVWGVDIGDNALKAIRLRRDNESFEVIAFDYIEHSKILSGESVTEGEREDIVAETLHEFVGRNEQQDPVGRECDRRRTRGYRC
ncbi:MAG: hypothetical protein ACYSWP_18675 [Planctomycetota bacterium]|jgi:type IV pilus assembly protein PilM